MCVCVCAGPMVWYQMLMNVCVSAGPMVWYQMFEYAVGHWLQKAAEHMLGCVLCSPGCFSLFRGSTLMDDNVMRTYATRSSEARHYLQYDQGVCSSCFIQECFYDAAWSFQTWLQNGQPHRVTLGPAKRVIISVNIRTSLT